MTKKKKIYDTLVDRDKKVIDLLENVKVATREQIQRVVYPNVSQNIPIRKLTMLTENKLVKRDYFNLGGHNNVYVYYLKNKPSKRNILHEITITDFITKVMSITEVVEVETSFKLGSVISDGYIKYKTYEGKTRHLFLEVQLSNKVSDCVEKYKNIKSAILEEKPNWQTIPRLIVITDLEHDNEQIKGLKVKYDTLQMNNLRELLF